MKKELIRLGYQNPELRVHLRPILDAVSNKIGARSSSENIALLVGQGSMTSFILYDISKVEEMVQDEDRFWEEFEDVIVAFGELKKANCKAGLYQVSRTAARKGYGPLLYDIMLSYAKTKGKLGIIPDRKEVSSAARYVWSYYYNKRSDVESFLDKNCRTWDDNVLDAYYSIKKPLNLSDLEMRHYEAKEMAIDQDIVEGKYDIFESHLLEVADSFADII